MSVWWLLWYYCAMNLLIPCFISRLVVLWGVLMLYSSPLLAEASNEQLLKEITSRLADKTQRQAAINAGQERALLCGYCHGADGNSVKSDVPNLAGQNPAYLLQQINKFARGERKDYVMNSLASKFSDEDQIKLAIFYSAQKLRPLLVDQRQARKGKAIYQQKCQSCHGENGHGKQDFARLAGQKVDYTIKTLQRFRGNARKQASSSGSKRSNLLMESVSRDLSDWDIERVAAFVAQLR